MASSSTSSNRKSFKYDVFLSFRGEDTRKTFVDHLYVALLTKGIHTYKDDETIKRGQWIGDELIRSIEESKFIIIIFSKNYASSAWCLDELVKIMECHKTTDHRVYPVFYDVEPSEVSEQIGSVGKAFAKHIKEETSGRWRQALQEAVNLAGWDVKNMHEAKVINQIVEYISLELRSIHLSINENLIGMEPRMKEVLSYLEAGFGDVYMIGIEGIVGVGKTALARSVFDRVSFRFEGISFVENVREVSKASLSGLMSLQQKVLSDVLNVSITIRSVYQGKSMIRTALGDRKVLLVLDDVDHIDQLEALAGSPNWFGKGSAIIVTTRDEQLLLQHGVKNIYHVNALSDDEAICLFSWYAFGGDIPVEGYKQLSLEVVHCTAGVPLAIKGLGSFLRGRDKTEWINVLQRLKVISLDKGLKANVLKQIRDILELSNMSLEDDDEELYLDVMKNQQIDEFGDPSTHESGILSMASSSTSSIRKSFKYDVFLSFRGEDTRKNFVDHLYHALQSKGIYTYKNDERIRKGRMTPDELIRSVEGSKFFIIVFSKNYASSAWCLDELVAIMECHRTGEQTAYPVFYDLEPREVRKQIGPVGEAFAKHSKNEPAGKWRGALQEAANLAGWELKKTADGHEAKFIQKLVEEISFELHSLNVDINSKIIGMEPLVKEVLSSIETGFDDVRILGIMGMGGVGKTTLARAIFHKVSFRFEGKSFVENVKAVSKSSFSNLKSLQEQVLSDVLDDEGITIHSVYEGKNMIKKELGDRKVLIVLDDVDQIEQLEALAGAPHWFGKGSIIIITTRDEKLLLAHGVKQIHRVYALSEEEAICLFSWYAFSRDIPVQGYRQLSVEVVRCAAGLPLAIKVLGLFLRGKNKREWIDVLQKLKVISLDEGLQLISQKQTLEILELSYISLEDEDKEIFLDVACFMKGLRENDAIRILESCGFPARIGLSVLVRKSLLTISNDRRLGMHDYIEDMGRNIVRRSHPNQPNQHSRLWIREEIEDILTNDLGTKATRRIELLEMQLSPDIVMRGFSRMKELRCLIVESETDNDDLSCNWKFDEVGQYFPNTLRFLRWLNYPVRFLPETFHADNLVALEMPYSKIIKLWEGGERKVLNNLRFLDFSNSELETLDLRLTPRLEWLELRECRDLVELKTPVGSLKRLVHLNLAGCSRFNSFMYIKHLESMGVLSLSKLNLNAKSLEELPRYASDDLSKLRFTCLYFGELTSSDRNGEQFVSLNLQSRTKLESVSGSICGLQHLRQLTFSGCIPEVPKDLDLLTYLEKLNFVSTHIKCLPDSICRLKHLKALKLQSCQIFEKLPEGLGQLEHLKKLTLLSTRITRLPDSVCMLKHLKSLKLKSCLLLQELPENLGRLEHLEKISLWSARISRLPDSICMLKHLKSLELRSCLILEKLPEDLGQLECLEKIDLLSARIKRLPDSICKLKHLRSLELKSCGSLEKLPEHIGQLECLEKLILTQCISLEDIPNSICKMNNLKCLHLPFCARVKKLPEELGQLKCLTELNVKDTGISHLPQSISLVEDLRIVGSVEVLQSCGLAPEIQTIKGETFCHIPVRMTTEHAPTEGVFSFGMSFKGKRQRFT